jgi:hypothetical protein
MVELSSGLGIEDRGLSRKRGRLSKMRSVCADLGLAAANAAVSVHQSAEFHIEDRLLVDLPFVVTIAAQGLSPVTLTRLAGFER